MYQYFIQTQDEDVEKFLKIFTFLSLGEIRNFMAQHNDQSEKRIAQKALAEHVTSLIHGKEECELAILATKTLFSNDKNDKKPFSEFTMKQIESLKGIAPTYEVSVNERSALDIMQLCSKIKLTKSNNELKKAMKSNTFFVNDKCIGMSIY